MPHSEMMDIFESIPFLGGEIGQGSVHLIDAMPRLVPKGGLGAEAAIVQAARVSYGAGTKTKRNDIDLVNFLFCNNHMSPFEMIVLKFRIRTQLFTARQWMRHRAGSFNEESARYSEIKTDFYIPDETRLRKQSSTNKQGSDSSQNHGNSLEKIRKEFLDELCQSYAQAQKTYELGLELGLSREIVRSVLPEGRYTSFYWKVDLRNLFGFLDQRLHDHAQEEIRRYSQIILEILKNYVPIATQAFLRYQYEAIRFSKSEQQIFQEKERPEVMGMREFKEWEKKMKLLHLRVESFVGGPHGDI